MEKMRKKKLAMICSTLLKIFYYLRNFQVTNTTENYMKFTIQFLLCELLSKVKMKVFSDYVSCIVKNRLYIDNSEFPYLRPWISRTT